MVVSGFSIGIGIRIGYINLQAVVSVSVKYNKYRYLKKANTTDTRDVDTGTPIGEGGRLPPKQISAPPRYLKVKL